MVTTLRDRICQDDHTGSRVRASLALRACSGASFKSHASGTGKHLMLPEHATTKARSDPKSEKQAHHGAPLQGARNFLAMLLSTSLCSFTTWRWAERYSLSAGAPARWGLESDLINGVTTRMRVIILELARVCKLGAPSLPSPRSKAQRRCLLLDVLPPYSLRNKFGRSPSVCSRPSVPPPTFCFFLLRRT